MAIKRLLSRLVSRKSWQTLSAVGLILLAGALIEVMSLLQYRYTHRLMERELDYRVESELTVKSMRVKGLLKTSEQMVRNYVWPVSRNIMRKESVYNIIHRLVATNKDVMSSFVAYVPGSYPWHDGLFEPGAYRLGDSIVIRQLAGDRHNYISREFYQEVIEQDLSDWSDPYVDTYASGTQVTTFAMPVTDEAGRKIAAFGIDLSTKGIIDTLNTRHNYPSTFFLLLTEGGKLISKPDSSQTKPSVVDMVVRMINDSTCERKRSSSGHSKIVTFTDKEKGKGYAYYAFMRGQPHWQVVMVCYDDEVFSKLKDMRRNMLLLMLGALTLLGFILYRVNQYVKRLHESRLSRERTQSELHIAQTIQSEMLPRSDIHRDDVDVSGRQITALEVGGDLYDYFIRDEKLYFCIGDVSGKGVPSSLVMAVVHTLFRSLSQNESNPMHIMQAINEASTEGNKTNMFVTLFIGVLDLPTGRLRYCNAGHDAPLLISHGVEPLQVKANLPVGLFDDFKYEMQQVQLQPGATLLLYTDGLTEATDSEGRLYGLQRIIDATCQCVEQGKTAPAVLMNSLYEAATAFVDGAPQSDDLTMLALHYHRPKETVILDKNLHLVNDVHHVTELNEFVKSVSSELNLEPSLVSQLMLAVEEAVVNVMSYAYPIGTQGDIYITARGTEKSIKFIITDEGKAFDPTLKSEADTTLSAEDRPIGGLGILLVQRLMDSINYERVDGKNVLTLKKDY